MDLGRVGTGGGKGVLESLVCAGARVSGEGVGESEYSEGKARRVLAR